MDNYLWVTWLISVIGFTAIALYVMFKNIWGIGDLVDKWLEMKKSFWFFFGWMYALSSWTPTAHRVLMAFSFGLGVTTLLLILSYSIS